MTRRPIVRALPTLLFVLALAGLGHGRPVLAQTAQPAASPPVADVRQIVTDARQEIERYKTAGGAAGAADHPAIKWHAALWEVHERSPQSEAGALAATEAIRLLSRAELWDRAHARIESLGFDDAAWERVPAAIYEEGVARKDLAYTVEKLSQAAASTTSAAIKAAALVVLGRAQRRLGDNEAATRTLEAARSAAPGTLSASQADGLIYEIAYLSIGLQAPAISGKPRNGRHVVDLAAFRGKPIVLVFWAST